MTRMARVGGAGHGEQTQARTVALGSGTLRTEVAGKIIKPNKLQLHRLTMEGASVEFGVDRATLAGACKRADCLPGPDGRYSIKQIASVIYGDLESERIREKRENADRLAMINEQMRRKLLPRSEIEQHWSNLILVCRQKLLSLGNKIAPRLVFCKGEKEMEHEINHEIDQALAELARSVGHENDDEFGKAGPDPA